MNVGVARVSLRIPENMDLKGKRQILKSIIGRVKSRFDVALAEVDDNDSWQSAVIGICCISNNKRHSNEVLSKVVRFIEMGRFDVHGFSRLYSHQAVAVNHVRAGKNVIIATSSASGKSLVYNIAVLQSILTQPAARALYLFPTKD